MKITPPKIINGRRPGPRPQDWFYPHDEHKTLKHKCWSRAKAQCLFRNEGWEITEPQWMNEIWPDHLFARRGKQGLELCMIRINDTKPWSLENVRIVTRRCQLILQKGPTEMAEVEPGVWDITGESLRAHEARIALAHRRRLQREMNK
jgi:hypothetical protein